MVLASPHVLNALPRLGVWLLSEITNCQMLEGAPFCSPTCSAAGRRQARGRSADSPWVLFALGVLLLLVQLGRAEQSATGQATVAEPVRKAHLLLQAGKTGDAAQVLQDFLRQSPTSADAWALLGRTYAELGADSDAGRCYRRALELNGRDATVLYDLGVLELRSGNCETATRYLGDYHKRRPNDAYVLLPLAHCLFRLQRTAAGLQAIEKALKANQRSVPWKVEAGRVLLAAGFADRAIGPLTDAFRLQPNAKDARLYLAWAESQLGNSARVIELLWAHPIADALYENLLGTALCNAGRCNEALSLLSSARRQNPDDKTLYLTLATAYEATSNELQALEVLREAHRRWPDDSDLRDNLARRLFVARDAAGAASLLETAKGLSRDEMELLAQCHVALGNLDKAARVAEEAVAQFGQTESSLLVLANVLQLESKDADVVSLLERHQPRFSSSARFLFTLAVSYYASGKYTAARDLLEKVLRLAPQLAQAQFLMGSCYSSLGEPERGLAHYKAALNLEPQNFLYHFQVGLVLSLLGDKPEAEAHLRRSIELNASHAPARYHLAELYFQTARNEFAMEQLEQAITLNPNFESYYYLLSRVYSRLGRAADSAAAMKRFQEIKEKTRAAAKELKEGAHERNGP